MGGALIAPSVMAATDKTIDFKSMRPVREKRCFTSQSVDKLIKTVKSDKNK